MNELLIDIIFSSTVILTIFAVVWWLRGKFDNIDNKFEKIDSRFEQIDGRFEQIDSRFEQIDSRFEKIDSRFEQIDSRFDQIDSRFDQINGRFEKIDSRFEKIDGRFVQIDGRFDKIENKPEKLSYVINSSKNLISLNPFTKEEVKRLQNYIETITTTHEPLTLLKEVKDFRKLAVKLMEDKPNDLGARFIEFLSHLNMKFCKTP